MTVQALGHRQIRMTSWDGDHPVQGDFLRTPAGTCYRIVDWRRTRPGSKSAAVAIVQRLDHDAVTEDQEGVFMFQWNPRR